MKSLYQTFVAATAALALATTLTSGLALANDTPATGTTQAPATAGAEPTTKLIPRLTGFFGGQLNTFRGTGQTMFPSPDVTYGLLGDFQISQKMVVESGLLVRTAGAEINRSYRTATSSGSVTDKFKLSYLSVPALIKFYNAPPETGAFFVKVGPSFSSLLKSQVENGGPGGGVNDNASNTEKFEVAAVYGAGYRTSPVGHLSIIIEMYGIYGLTKVNTEGDDDIKNSSPFGAALSLGYEL